MELEVCGNENYTKLATQEIEGKDILIVGTDDQHGCQVGEAGNLNTLANAEAPVNF